VSNDLRVGGKYFARMEHRDGRFGFDFEAVYLEVNVNEGYTYEFGGRLAQVELQELDGKTELRVTFDSETELPVELQRNGWQAILDNFKKYVESQTGF